MAAVTVCSVIEFPVAMHGLVSVVDCSYAALGVCTLKSTSQ